MEEMNELSIDLITEPIANKDYQRLREIFDEYNIVDLAEIVSLMEIEDIMIIIRLLRKEVSAELFTYLESDIQEKLVSTLSSPQIREILDNLQDDDMVDFIGELPSNLAKQVLSIASPDTRKDINFLLSFKEDSAGSILTTEYIELDIDDNIGQAIDKIKKQGKVAENITHCYVVDKKRQLKGELELKEIIFEDRNVLIKDLIDEDLVAVQTNDDQEEVAKVFKKYDITTVPVVNDDNCLVGIITVDDILDVIEEEVTEDIQKMHAVAPLDGSYIEASILDVVKSRLPWLLILMVSATFTGNIIAGYEEALAMVPALNSFIPMLMGTGGNAGSQSSTMVIRGISVDGLSIKDFFSVFFKEFQVSMICGALLFVINVIRILIFTNCGMKVALVVSITLFFTVLVSKIVGGLLPLITLLFKQDPAAVAAPVITTISDALTLIIYFTLATNLLGI
ncbi:MAG: magnesium transporter [Erysipelotrichaceae bacterium]|nr:magnesium transporter [Erysipelotrichaceae bacterium]